MVIRVPERVGYWGSGDNSKGCLAAGNLLPAESQTLVLGALRDHINALIFFFFLPEFAIMPT